jgi:chaperonin GroES
MSKPTIKPRGQYILVKQDTPEDRENQFGLLMPSNVEQEQKSQGEVYAVSEQIKDIKKGDKVIYGMFAGEQLKVKENLKEVDYKLIHSDDIIAFIS